MKRVKISGQFAYNGFSFILFDNNTFMVGFDGCDVDLNSLEDANQVSNILMDAICEMNTQLKDAMGIRNTLESSIADMLGMQHSGLLYSIPEDMDVEQDPRYTYNHCEECDEPTGIVLHGGLEYYVCERCQFMETHE